MKTFTYSRFIAILAFFTAGAYSAYSQEKKPADPSLLTLERIFSASEFDAERGPSLRWRSKGGYMTLESAPGGQQIVVHDPATGKRDVLVPNHWLIPAKETRPLSIEGYEFCTDEAR